MLKKSIIIDSDPGIDDAVALITSFFAPTLDIRLICSTAGNLGIDTTTQNALHLCELFEQNIPVAKGLAHPLNRPLDVPHGVHGKMGFGNYVYSGVKTKPINLAAHEAMHLALQLYPKSTILILGPLTNVAMLLKTYPEDVNNIEEIVFMGGSKDDILKQDVPYPEFNISRDPTACEIVLQSGANITIIPMDFGHYGYIATKEIEKLPKINQTGELFKLMYADYNDRHVSKEYGAATHDSCATAYLIEPLLFKTENVKASIKYINNHGILYTKITKNKSKIKLAVDMNVSAFKNLYFGLLSVAKTKDE